MVNSYAVAFKLRLLFAVHLHTLKHVTIQGISFRYGYGIRHDEDSVVLVDIPTLATILSSSFIQLLEQPELHALCACESTVSASTLVKKFLTTPASHEQTLYVERLDEQDLMEREEDNSDEDDEEEQQEEITSDSDKETIVVKKQRITKPREMLAERIESRLTWSCNTSFFPETNAQFKCLDLGHSSSCIHSLLFSLPELKLKKLRMRTQDMTLVPAGIDIKVEHVVFSTQTCTSYKPTISLAHLEKFTISNPVLKRLEFEHPTDECAPGLIPALIHCLSKLYQQERGLDELVLDSITFGVDLIRELFLTACETPFTPAWHHSCADTRFLWIPSLPKIQFICGSWEGLPGDKE